MAIFQTLVLFSYVSLNLNLEMLMLKGFFIPYFQMILRLSVMSGLSVHRLYINNEFLSMIINSVVVIVI